MKPDLDKELDALLERVARQRGLHPMSMGSDEANATEDPSKKEPGWKGSRTIRVMIVGLAATVLITTAFVRFSQDPTPSSPPASVEHLQTEDTPLEKNMASVEPNTKDQPPTHDANSWYKDALNHVDDGTLATPHRLESATWRRELLRAVADLPEGSHRAEILIEALGDPSQLIRKVAAVALGRDDIPALPEMLQGLFLPASDWQTRVNLFRHKGIQESKVVPHFVNELLDENLNELDPPTAIKVLAYCINRGSEFQGLERKLFDLLYAATQGRDASDALYSLLSFHRDRLNLDSNLSELIRALLSSTEKGILRSAFRINLRWIGFDHHFRKNANRDLIHKKASLESLYRERAHVQADQIHDVRSFSLDLLVDPELRPYIYPLLLHFKGQEAVAPLRRLLQGGFLHRGESDCIRLIMIAIDDSSLPPTEIKKLNFDSTDPKELVMILAGMSDLQDELLTTFDLIPDDLFRILDNEPNTACVLGALRILDRIAQKNPDVQNTLKQKLRRYLTHEEWLLQFSSALVLAHNADGKAVNNEIALLISILLKDDRDPVFMSHLRTDAPDLYNNLTTTPADEISLDGVDLQKLLRTLGKLELDSL